MEGDRERKKRSRVRKGERKGKDGDEGIKKSRKVDKDKSASNKFL